MSSLYIKTNFSIQNLKKQHGVILIVMLVLLVVGSSAFLVNAMSSSSGLMDRNKNTSLALSQAKDILIAYAASNNTPGQLPCPEDTAKIGTANEGDALASCTLPAIGRLPWRKLGIDNLRDGNGDQIWYVLSPGFHGSSINSDTPAQLTVDGLSNSAVAIIFSAGAPINGQSRPIPTAGTPPDVTQYLELSNNDGDNTFVSSGPAATFNDKLLLITHDDLFRVVEKRVAGEVKQCLDQYALSLANHGRYPWASTLSSYADNTGQFFGRIPDTPFTATQGSSGGTMMMGSMTGGMDYTWVGSCSIVSGSGWWLNWKDLVFYGLSSAYQPSSFTPTGCTSTTCLIVNPPSISADKKYVVIVAGKRLATQSRPSSSPTDYLEGGNQSANQSGNYSFTQGNPTSTFNDTVVSQK